MAAPKENQPILEEINSDENVEEAWAAEIQTRMAAVENGQFSAKPWREAIESIRQSLHQ